MQDSLTQLSLAVDSLRTILDQLGATQQGIQDSLIQISKGAGTASIGHAVRTLNLNVNTGSSDSIIMVVFAFVGVGAAWYAIWQTNRLFERDKRLAKQRADQTYAAMWRAVLREVADALGRMRDQIQNMNPKERGEKKSFYLLEIALMDGLAVSFLRACEDAAVADKFRGLYNQIVYYRDSYHLAVERSRDYGNVDPEELLKDPAFMRWFGSAQWVCLHRHSLLVNDFEFCRDRYNDFLERNIPDWDKMRETPIRLREGLDLPPA